jgi:hypothetical protein
VDARAAAGGGVGSTLGGGAWGEGSWCRCGGLMLGSMVPRVGGVGTVSVCASGRECVYQTVEINGRQN